MVMPIIGRAGRPSPDDHALAACLAPDGVFRVPRPSAATPAPRLRSRVAVVAAALAMCAIPAVGLAGLGQGGPPVRYATSDMGAVVEARYQAALVLGNDGRYAEALEVMRTVVPYRSSQAAVRSWSTRAAQRLLADARRRLRPTRTVPGGSCAGRAPWRPGSQASRRPARRWACPRRRRSAVRHHQGAGEVPRGGTPAARGRARSRGAGG